MRRLVAVLVTGFLSGPLVWVAVDPPEPPVRVACELETGTAGAVVVTYGAGTPGCVPGVVLYGK